MARRRDTDTRKEGERGEMNIAGLHLEKNVMNASGTLSKENLDEVKDLYGALVTKTVTLEPRMGNPPPRVAEVPGGMINSIGLQNVGIEKFLAEEIYEWDVGLPVIVSIWGGHQRDTVKMCKLLKNDERVSAIELNLSCPNADSFSAPFGTLMLCCARLEGKPLIIKLSVDNVLYNAPIVARYADALTLINTIPALTWIPDSSEPLLGGLSGPAIKPIALRAVYEVTMAVDVTVIGCGGISSNEDIEDFMEAGASAVQIGSGSFVREPGEIVGTS